MKYISPLFSDARNKLGGTVFARNRAGTYARAKVDPVQPRTVSQQANRAAFTAVTSMWPHLTAAQRTAWNALAETATIVDSLGQHSMPSGFQIFTQCGRNAVISGNSPNAAPVPSAYTPQFPGTPGPLTAVAVAGLITQLNIAQPTPGSGTAFFSFAATAPLSPGITFVAQHRYRNIFVDTNDDGPWNLSTPWSAVFGTALAIGSQIAVRIRVFDTSAYLPANEYFFLATVT